ncbi:MAG: integrase [Cytophagales bacterium]|nr:MAG: integrase [Cytophagales bacterium]
MIQSFLNYIQYEKRYSPHTRIAYENDLLQFQDFLIQTHHQEDITLVDTNQIKHWIIQLSETNIHPNSINRKISTLKSFYKFLQREHQLSLNPASRVKLLKSPKRNPEFITEEKMIVLLDNLQYENDFSGKRDQLILEILYNTGIRVSELLGIGINDVDFYQSTIKVFGKRKRERIIPILKPLLALIEQYEETKKNHFAQVGISPQDFLILSDKGEQGYHLLIYNTVKKYLTDITTQSKKSPHVIRHSFATHLLDKGADLNAIKELLGHSSLAATQVYTHNSLEKLKTIFEQAHPKA